MQVSGDLDGLSLVFFDVWGKSGGMSKKWVWHTYSIIWFIGIDLNDKSDKYSWIFFNFVKIL